MVGHPMSDCSGRLHAGRHCCTISVTLDWPDTGAIPARATRAPASGTTSPTKPRCGFIASAPGPRTSTSALSAARSHRDLHDRRHPTTWRAGAATGRRKPATLDDLRNNLGEQRCHVCRPHGRRGDAGGDRRADAVFGDRLSDGARRRLSGGCLPAVAAQAAQRSALRSIAARVRRWWRFRVPGSGSLGTAPQGGVIAGSGSPG